LRRSKLATERPAKVQQVVKITIWAIGRVLPLAGSKAPTGVDPIGDAPVLGANPACKAAAFAGQADGQTVLHRGNVYGTNVVAAAGRAIAVLPGRYFRHDHGRLNGQRDHVRVGEQ